MFTPKEYARLLELMYLGMQVITAHQGPDTPAAQRYGAIEQKILDLASALGCGDLVTIGGDGRLVPSEKIREDQSLAKIIDEHNNDVFWHALVTRLADRDLAAEQARLSLSGAGGPAIDADARLRQLEDFYWDEFEKNDLANVVLLRGGKG